MNVYDLSARITLDASDYEQGVGSVKKSSAQLKSDVAKLAAEYKAKGMDASSAMKKAWSEIDKSQYESAGAAKKSTEIIKSSWEEAAERIPVLGNIIKTAIAGAAIIAGAKKLASAVAEIGKASFAGYAEYEQLVGGVETLFKSSSDTIQKYAANAYKTAGMSANDYMSTVTSFSASLLQSLGNDTVSAAKYADMAITDMSDNANKMGTSMESIQNAYQGFAKQNYTMLDNLKLGYGGTKSEMERLLADAEEIKRANGETVSYSIDRFSDMVEAIHVVQTEMDITGTTAAEAEGTIEGSVNSMKAAWSNLAVGMADNNADMEQLTQAFVDSVATAGKNIVPRVKQIVVGVGSAITDGVSYLRETNSTVDLLITAIDGVATAATVAGAAILAIKVGDSITGTATAFWKISATLATLTVESGKAAIAEATLNGTFSVSEVLVGVLTGKISLATAAQYAWNTAVAANPLGLLAAVVAAVAVATVKATKAHKEYVNELAGTPETVDEAKQKLDELKRKYAEAKEANDELYKTTPTQWRPSKEMNDYADAIKVAEENLAALEEQERQAAEEAATPANRLKAASEEYAEAAAEILADFQETYESVYNGLHNAATAFTDVIEPTKVTWENAMENINANAQVLENMDANFNAISEAAGTAGVDISGFSEMLASMSTEDAAGFLSTISGELEGLSPDSAEAKEKLTQLTDAITRWKEAGGDYSEGIALSVEAVSSRLDEISKKYADAVDGLNLSAEAYEGGTDTIDGLISGIDSSTPGVLSSLDSLASQMKSRLTTSFSDYVLTIKANVVGSKNRYDAYAKNGLDYVPFDNFIACLHKGEKVLTAEEAAAYRAGENSGGGSGSPIIYQYIQTPVDTPAELAAATEAYFQQARWAI